MNHPNTPSDRKMFTVTYPMHEALYFVTPDDSGVERAIPRPNWAKYQIGCDRCDWWAFEGSRWRAFLKLYRHRCRG